MLGCGVILAYVLFETGGLGIWLHAPVLFANALRQTALGREGLTMTSVVAMVICGADYQQFVLAADRPATARTGCLLAAGVVFAVGFLPASTVIATRSFWQLNNVTDSVQVVPMLLMHALSHQISPNFIIAVLVASALGAGCAILRAMSDALTTVGPRCAWQSIWSRIFPVVLSCLVATRGQSLVDMMVDLNMVCLAAVGPLLGLRLLRVRVSDTIANTSMAAGSAVAIALYLLRWAGMVALPEASTVLISLPIALGLAAVLHHHMPATSRGPERSTHSMRPVLIPWLHLPPRAGGTADN